MMQRQHPDTSEVIITGETVQETVFYNQYRGWKQPSFHRNFDLQLFHNLLFHIGNLGCQKKTMKTN